MSETTVAGTRYLVPVRDVERVLNQQMKALQGEGERPMQRARMSNLVIFCSSLEQSILINEQVPAISAVHPTRTILLVGEPGPDRDLTARVTVRPIGTDTRHGVCAEMVTLHAGGRVVDRLPFAVRALLIGDLPVNLWWTAPSPPPLSGALLYDLSECAQQVIYDSIGWPDPARGVAATGHWLEQVERPGLRWRVASDLNWRRLKYWRRLLVESLGSAAAAGAGETVHEIQLEHGPHAVVQAWLLASWLTSFLGWKVQVGKVTTGQEMAWRFRASSGEGAVVIRRLDEGPPQLRRLRIACRIAGQETAFRVEADAPDRLSMQIEGSGQPRTITVPPTTAVDLVGRQLSDRHRDPIFRASMSTATVMAQSLLH